MKKQLFEIQYDKVFSPRTLATLKGQSGEALRQALGGPLSPQRLTSLLTQYPQLLKQIMGIETPYKDLLEGLAVQMVTEAYPIIDYANIEIDAKLGPGGMNLGQPGEEEDEEPPMDFHDQMPEEKKRKIINGITQGASIRGTYGYLLFREYLDQIDGSLVEKYKEVLKPTFGIFDDESVVAMIMAMMSSKQLAGSAGGESEAEYNEETGNFIIRARAMCFPMLVHEIVKGLYEIVSLQGFGPDKEKNQSVAKNVDKLEDEPEDMRYGKFIYDAVNNIYLDSDYNDPRIREFLFAEIYKLSDDDFLTFIENAINGELTSSQKRWAMNAMRDISRDLGKDDTGLEDLG